MDKNILSTIAMVFVRASTLDVVNVPNAKYLAHLPHQTPKTIFIRRSKCYNFCNIWIVPLHIYHCTEGNGILINIFLFSFLSPLSSVYYFLFSLTDSLLSHLCHRRSLTSCILHRHRRSLQATSSSSSSSIGIDVGIDVEVRSECSSRSWASTLRSWSWASTLRWGEILIVGCRC